MPSGFSKPSLLLKPESCHYTPRSSKSKYMWDKFPKIVWLKIRQEYLSLQTCHGMILLPYIIVIENQQAMILLVSLNQIHYLFCTKLKVHFVIHTFIPPFCSRNLEIFFLPTEDLSYIMFMWKIFLADLLVGKIMAKFVQTGCQHLKIPTFTVQFWD